MDSKIVKDARLADLVLKTVDVCAKVSDIPGASINAGNVELDMSKFGEEAKVIFALSEESVTDSPEKATINHVGEVATLDFTQAQTADSVIKVCVHLKL